MKHFKHILMVFLAVLLLAGIIPLSAMAAENQDNQVCVIVENQTLTKDQGAPWSGKLVDEWVAIDSSSTMMSCVKTALDHHKYSSTGTEKNYITEINGLSAGTGEPKAGWMGTLNDWCTNEGVGAYTVKDKTLSAGDVIDILYSMNYGEDIGGSWNNNDKTLKDLSVSTGTLDPTFASATKSYTLTLDQGEDSVQVTPTANNKNFQVKTYLGTQESGIEYRTGQAIPVKNVGWLSWVKNGDLSGTTGQARRMEAIQIVIVPKGTTPQI